MGKSCNLFILAKVYYYGRMKLEGQSMIKKGLALSLVLVVASVAGAQNWFTGSLEEALAKARNEKKLVLIDFYSGG